MMRTIKKKKVNIKIFFLSVACRETRSEDHSEVLFMLSNTFYINTQ